MAQKTVKCVALVEFTRFVEGYGQIVGAPESSLDEAKRPEVPLSAVKAFVKDGLVKAPKGFDADEAADEAVAVDAEATAAP